MWLFDLFYPEDNIEASTKAEWVVRFIIREGRVSLPRLMRLKVNGSGLASVSTHISDWRAYARKLGYEIVNHSKHGKKFISEYEAIPLWKSTSPSPESP